MTTTHTPTPWKVTNKTGHVCIDGDACVAELNTENQITTQLANAAFIVRAVNAHEELVTRLHTAYVDWHFAVGHEPSWAECKNPQCFLNKQFIAKAEGK